MMTPTPNNDVVVVVTVVVIPIIKKNRYLILKVNDFQSNRITGSMVSLTDNQNKLDSYVEAGLHTISWNGKDRIGKMIPTGIYFMKVVSGENIVTKKLAYLK